MPSEHGKWVGGQRNAYEEVPGFPEIVARVLGLKLSPAPNRSELNCLLDFLGSVPLIRRYAPDAAASLALDGRTHPDLELLDLIEGTGVLGYFPARTILGRGKPVGSVNGLLIGSLVPDMRGQIRLLSGLKKAQGVSVDNVYALANNRDCTALELLDPLVREVQTEEDLAREHLVLQLMMEREGLDWTGHHVLSIMQELESPRDVADNVLRLVSPQDTLTVDDRIVPSSRNILATGKFFVPSSHGRLWRPLLVRRVIRQVWRSFDARVDQMWTAQYMTRLARRPEHLCSPQHVSSGHWTAPLDLIPALVHLVRELYLLNDGEQLD
jgi:hypothetical protein